MRTTATKGTTAMSRTLSIEEAALQLRCNPETLRRAIRRKELIATKEPLSRGPRFVIDVMDLKAFLEKRRTA